MIERPQDDDPVAAARDLIQILRSRSAEGEIARRLPQATDSDLRRLRLFEILVPQVHGGRQATLSTFMDVAVELGRGDGSTSWVFALVAASTWLLTTLFPQHVTDPIFASGRFIAAGAITPRSIKTRRTADGIIIDDGIWGYNSGVHHADWNILGIPIFGEDGAPIDFASALIPVAEVALLDDWDTLGLRGTGSTSVQAKDVFVPHDRIALFSRAMQGDYASSHLRDEPLYRLPLIPFLAMKDVFPLLGMARAALEMFCESTTTRAIPYMDYPRQDEAVVTHLQVAEAEAKTGAAELLLRENLERIEGAAAAGRPFQQIESSRTWRNTSYANRLLWEAVDLLASSSSSSAFIGRDSAMNRVWRDARVASLHGGLRFSSAFEVHGAMMMGKAPKTHFV
jgi:3-hydroxy-9,10-secoandrosta-1,3,5(10)-triene-9,17-dione monooxygenase